MTRTEVRNATHEGELPLGKTVIPCAVLDDGTRLLTQQGFLRAIGRARSAKGGQGSTKGEVIPFMAAANLAPFITPDLSEAATPIRFRSVRGKLAFGYRADLLPKVCEVYLSAQDAGALVRKQEPIAATCNILMRGLAHVGIMALVDEATGYQEVRDRLALQAILDKYVTNEWAKWTKTFPDDFYRHLFRLKGMSYPPPDTRKPSFVGHWTNDIVYARLGQGILDELKRKNPRLPSGTRRRKHHQHLTREIGHPELREHLSNVTFLMRSCQTWNDFYRRLNRAVPKYGNTFELELDD